MRRLQHPRRHAAQLRRLCCSSPGFLERQREWLQGLVPDPNLGMHIYIYISLSLSLCLSLSISSCLSFALYTSPSPYMCIYIYISLCLFLSLSLSLSVSLSLSLYLSIYISICIYIYIPLSLSPSLSHTLHTRRVRSARTPSQPDLKNEKLARENSFQKPESKTTHISRTFPGHCGPNDRKQPGNVPERFPRNPKPTSQKRCLFFQSYPLLYIVHP